MPKEYIHKKLIVEGEGDKRFIPELMKHNGIPWEKERPVEIIPSGGDRLIDAEVISTELKASGLKALGLIVDADSDLAARWQSVRNASLKSMPDFPKELPVTGLIHTTTNGIKFGVWIMPDNQSQGMLESFSAYMIPDQNELIWQYALEVTKESKSRGALFKDSHLPKAHIYSWLAWQNPPGLQLHIAIKNKILNPQHPKAQAFVNWFKTLYDL